MARAAGPVAVGTELPDSTFFYIDNAGSRQSITLSELTMDKRVGLVAFPEVREAMERCARVPGYAPLLSALGSAARIDTVACITQEDPVRFHGWQEDQMMLLSDENGAFTNALGLNPATARYCLVVKDNVVKFSSSWLVVCR